MNGLYNLRHIEVRRLRLRKVIILPPVWKEKERKKPCFSLSIIRVRETKS